MEAELWKLFYSRWKNNNSLKRSGYSILMMVPGDLPVFLKIALAVCSLQDPKYLTEVLVIPDKIPPGFMDYFKELSKQWNNSPIRLVELSSFEYFLTKRLNNPNSNNWLQFVRGCNYSNSTHVLWHDSDLFILERYFLKRQFENCIRSNFACYGVSEVWDKWYRNNGFPHLTATWELMAELDWVRSFEPWQHRGHVGSIQGHKKMFDSTLLPQCLTSAHRIDYEKNFQNHIHFNYVISSYRHFQNKKGPYEDVGLKLVIIRILIDLYDDSGWKYDVPEFSDLMAGVNKGSHKVTYLDVQRRAHYLKIRDKFKALERSSILDLDQRNILNSRLNQLDSIFLNDTINVVSIKADSNLV